jgi:hypothetical protein
MLLVQQKHIPPRNFIAEVFPSLLSTSFQASVAGILFNMQVVGNVNERNEFIVHLAKQKLANSIVVHEWRFKRFSTLPCNV